MNYLTYLNCTSLRLTRVIPRVTWVSHNPMSFLGGLKRCTVLPAPYKLARLGLTRQLPVLPPFHHQARSKYSYPGPKPRYNYQNYQGRRPRYSRFDDIKTAWHTSPEFRKGVVVVGGVAVVFYVANLEKVPVCELSNISWCCNGIGFGV